MVAALAAEAGLPDGVLNIIHGNHVSIFVQPGDIILRLQSLNVLEVWNLVHLSILLYLCPDSFNQRVVPQHPHWYARIIVHDLTWMEFLAQEIAKYICDDDDINAILLTSSNTVRCSCFYIILNIQLQLPDIKILDIEAPFSLHYAYFS